MHKIRLRQPWQRIRSGEAESTRVDVPDQVDSRAAQCRPGSVTYTRRFNQPSGLDDNSRIYLRIESWTGSLEAVSLNDQTLEASDPPLEIEITGRIELHNQVRISLASDDHKAARLSGAVELLIK